MQSNNSFLPGQYSYPFTFTVPSGVPGTYVYETGEKQDKMEWKWLYTLYAEIWHTITPAETDGMIGRAMCPIVVMQQARNPYVYNIISELNSYVTTFWWWSNGLINLKCLFEKYIFRIDEKIKLTIDVDLSKCSTGIKNIVWVLRK